MRLIAKGRAWIRETFLISKGRTLEPYGMCGHDEEFVKAILMKKGNGFIILRVAVAGWVRLHVGYGFIGFNEEIILYL